MERKVLYYYFNLDAVPTSSTISAAIGQAHAYMHSYEVHTHKLGNWVAGGGKSLLI